MELEFKYYNVTEIIYMLFIVKILFCAKLGLLRMIFSSQELKLKTKNKTNKKISFLKNYVFVIYLNITKFMRNKHNITCYPFLKFSTSSYHCVALFLSK